MRCGSLRVDNMSSRDGSITKAGFLSDEHLASFENWLDAKFRLPGTNFRFGLDGIIGLIPGIGDIFTAGLSTVFIAEAVKIGARKRTLVRMVGNILFDMGVGAIPLVGDIFDFGFRANTKNLRLLKEEKSHQLSR